MVQFHSFQRSDTVVHSTTPQPDISPRQVTVNEEPESNDVGDYGNTRELFSEFQASSNSLVNMAAELLSILVTMPQQQQPADLPEFREGLVKQVSDLNNRGRLNGYSQRLMDRASYVICAALDEGINNTTWGRQSGWENHSLLSRLFQQRNGGEVFFVLLEQARQQSETQTELMELMYILIRLGFRGRYLNLDEHGRDGHELARMCSELYEELKRQRPATAETPPPESDHSWRALSQFRQSLFLSILPVIVLVAYIATALWINQHTQKDINITRTLQEWRAEDRVNEDTMMRENTEDNMGRTQ